MKTDGSPERERIPTEGIEDYAELAKSPCFPSRYREAKAAKRCVNCWNALDIFPDRRSRVEYWSSALCPECQPVILEFGG